MPTPKIYLGIMNNNSSNGDSENERSKVRVLTAGGAASSTSPSSSRNKKKQLKKKQSDVDQSDVVGEFQQATTSTAAVTSSTSKDADTDEDSTKVEAQNAWDRPEVPVMALELEDPSQRDEEDDNDDDDNWEDEPTDLDSKSPYTDDDPKLATSMDPHNTNSMYPSSSTQAVETTSDNYSDIVWLTICFLGIMASFVCYGLLLEYTTSGGRELHELSFLFVTSGLYTLTAAAGRYVRDETPSTIPPARFALLGLTSMGSTFCSVRSLRYV
jgi:hypothetical protein